MTATDRRLPHEPPITVDQERWLPALPADVRIEGFPTGAVYRADVFRVAERWRAGEVSARALAAVVLAWGFGPVGYGVHRTVAILAADPDGERLSDALTPLRADRPSEADLQESYMRFRTSAHVRGLGASFFTKLIYFAGYRYGIRGVQPLILDAVVARNLPREAGLTSRMYAWRSDEWMSYLRWAAHQGAEPDHVEIAHFVPDA